MNDIKFEVATSIDGDYVKIYAIKDGIKEYTFQFSSINKGVELDIIMRGVCSLLSDYGYKNQNSSDSESAKTIAKKIYDLFKSQGAF